VLSPEGSAPSDGFWPLMDQYFRNFTGKYGELEMIFTHNDKVQCGLADADGNVVIEPKYDYLFYKPDRPIITQNRESGVFTVITEDEEILFSVEGVLDLFWLEEEPNSFMCYVDEREIGEIRVYDIAGEQPYLRVGESFAIHSYFGAFCYGLSTESDQDGNSLLVNKSGNILYSAKLPEGFEFLEPWFEPPQNDLMIIYDANGKEWGTLDLDGNLVPYGDK